MHIVVHHRITDQARFGAIDPQDIAARAPSSARPCQYLPARDGSAAHCVWEAESLDELRGYLDNATDGSCQNTYFVIASESAIGTPDPAATT